MQPQDTAVSVRGVCRSYVSTARKGLIPALGPVDLDVPRGEFLAIVGPSGCGKSTLLRILAGILRPSSGECVITNPGAAPIVSMVFQNHNVFPWKTVEDNVAFGLRVRGVAKREARERAAEVLKSMGLGSVIEAYPYTLSGGMRQRVAIARAIVVDPDLILMDEPFASLDAQLRMLLQESLARDLHRGDHKSTVIFVTHSLEEAVYLGDRIMVMSSSPGHWISEYQVPLPRPRRPEMRTEPEFTKLVDQLWSDLRGELDNSFVAPQDGKERDVAAR